MRLVVAEEAPAPQISVWYSRAASLVMTRSNSQVLGAGKFGSAVSWSLTLVLALTGPSMADYRGALSALEAGDMAAAVEQLRLASAENDPSAQYLLGFIKEFGEGDERDYAAAAQLYRRAAEQDLAEAQTALARLYADGRGVTRDWPEAARWYARAAAQGHGLAQNDLAILHANGLGVRRDPARARELLELALENLPAGTARSLALLNLQRLTGEAGGPRIADEPLEPELLEIPELLETPELPENPELLDTPEFLETEAGPDALPGVSYLADGNAETGAKDERPNPRAAMAETLATAPALAAPADPSSHCVSIALARLSKDPSDTSEKPPDSESVQRAQQLLADLGYEVGPADGVPGPRTVKAVCRFEIDHNWAPTGRISERLLRGLSLVAEARRAAASP